MASSAFGMKPATTSNTNTGSIFGQPQQPQQQPATSIFGTPPTQPQQQQQQPASLFSVPPNQQTGGLFGQQQPQQQQQPATTNLFGQPQQQQPAATTNLFGQPQQQQQQPATGATGLFGQPAQQQQQQQQPATNIFGQTQQQQPSTNIFGQQQQQQPAQPATNIFGQPQQQQQQTQPQTSNLFGGSLFGNTANQQQQNATPNPLAAQGTLPASAFGAPSTTTGTGGAFGGFGTGAGSSLFGAKSQQPQQSTFNNQNQVATLANNSNNGVPPFTKSTKFNDLPDFIQQKLEQIETHIQGRVQICKDLQQRKLGDEPTKSHDAIRNLKKELISTATTIRNDLHLSKDLKAKVDQAVEDTIVATHIIDGFKNPQSGNTYLKDHASFPLEYFTRVTDQMKERLTWYKSTIEQIERKLASASGSSQTPQSISATLQAQHSTFLALASKTAAVDAELQKIKVYYTQLWRSKTGSVRDPFNDVVKSGTGAGNDFGLSGLNVR
uniref:Nucleoporin nup45 n=1 Tax=Psilocybe cubensis TaxID=181762 RepID=A0A8H7Y0A2_PSICU